MQAASPASQVEQTLLSGEKRSLAQIIVKVSMYALESGQKAPLALHASALKQSPDLER